MLRGRPRFTLSKQFRASFAAFSGEMISNSSRRGNGMQRSPLFFQEGIPRKTGDSLPQRVRVSTIQGSLFVRVAPLLLENGF
ncbi:hypothetical protein SDC9_54678 [bioreactor metagenome]|uniref:Uncharacterized protein n=1 Tax=bioreactor metagenome TaxID=1076179 RepID=A0A644WWS7_9ZZZZ